MTCHTPSRVALILVVVLSAWPAVAATSRSCPDGAPVTTFRVVVKPGTAGPALALPAMNVVEAGDRLVYQPIGHEFKRNHKAEIAIILVPEDASALPLLLAAKPASGEGEWPVPIRVAAIGVVLGPQGINERKLMALLKNDPGAVNRLADAAEQNSRVEALVQALAKYEQSAPGATSLQSVLNGFSSRYGVSLPALDRSKPADEQAASLLQAIAPVFSGSGSARSSLATQSGGLAASMASLFFGAPVSLAMGGAALVGNLHTSFFPPTEFQSAFAQQADTGGLALCAGGRKADAGARLALVWMVRLPDADPPAVSLATAPAAVPLGWPSTIRLRCETVAQLKVLPRAREWRLVSGSTEVPVPATIQPGDSTDAITLDLTDAKLPPGEYRLTALWDWTPLRVAGGVEVRPFSDLSAVTLTPTSEDRLIAGAGRVSVELTGADFEFVDSVMLGRAGSTDGRVALAFELPRGLEAGEQSTVTATVDVTAMAPGSYVLALRQLNGSVGEVPIAVHPPNPTLAQLPLHANVGERHQVIRLHGTALERIVGMTSPDATWRLSPVDPGLHGVTEREVEVELGSHSHAGEVSPIEIVMAAMHGPTRIAGGLQVLDPRPTITGIVKSSGGGARVALRNEEIVLGAPASFVVHADGLGSHPSLRLSCNPEGSKNLTLVPGQRDGATSLEAIGQDSLFLAFNPDGIGHSGCDLTATVMNDATGSSDPYRLGRLVRVPAIETFEVTNEKVGDALYSATLVGESLELIEKTGWSAVGGIAVQGIPVPVLGRPGKETLSIAVSWPAPSPRAPLYIWLRGEKEARLSGARY